MRIHSETPTGNLGRIGKIKVGKKTDRGLPTSLDYFRFDCGDNKMWEEEARRLFGSEPKSLPIKFFTANDDISCDQRYELRTHDGKLAGKGDGKHYWLVNEHGQWHMEADRKKVAAYVTRLKTEKYKPEWQEVCYLRFVLSGYPVLGYWELYTKGASSTIKNLVGVFDQVRNLTDITRVNFLLRVERHTSNRAGSKSRYPVVSLYPEQAMNDDRSRLVGGSALVGDDAGGQEGGGRLLAADEGPAQLSGPGKGDGHGAESV